MQQFPQSERPHAAAGGRAPVHRPPPRDLLPAVVAVRPARRARWARSAWPPCSNRGTSYRALGRHPGQPRLVAEPDHRRSAAENTFGFDSPATYTSRQFNTLLGTDSFLDVGDQGSGLTTAVESGALTRDRRPSLALGGARRRRARGDQRGVARIPSSPTGWPTRRSTSYLQWEIDNNVTQSQSAEQFFESLLVPYQKRLDDAREALATYVSHASGAGSDATAPPTSRSQIASLTEAVTPGRRPAGDREVVALARPGSPARRPPRTSLSAFGSSTTP